MDAVTVHLGGRLGLLFGKEWKLHVSSPAEAIRAININTKGRLEQYLRKDDGKNPYRVCLQNKKNSIGVDELQNKSGKSDIYIMPVIRGKNSGWGKIIAGVILIIVGVLLYAYGGGVLTKAGAEMLGAAVIGMGASLVLGGITQLLTPIPKSTQQLQSFNFQGNATTVNQGQCVPVFYGRYLISPVPISIVFDSQDTNAGANNIPMGGGNDGGAGNFAGGGYNNGGGYLIPQPGITQDPLIPLPDRGILN